MTDQQKYFETYRDLFLQDGWKQLMTEVSSDIQVLNQIGSVNTLEDLHFRRGQLATLTAMLNLEQSIKTAEEEHEAVDESLE